MKRIKPRKAVRRPKAKVKPRPAPRKKLPPKAAKRAAPKVTPPDEISEAMFPAATRLFWLAHGVNCLLSDYVKGTWTPLFPGIYTGGPLPSQDELTTAVVAKFAKVKTLPSEAEAALAWTVSSPKLLWIYWCEAMRKMQHSHPEMDAPEIEYLIRRPQQASVWNLFYFLRQKILSRHSGL